MLVAFHASCGNAKHMMCKFCVVLTFSLGTLVYSLLNCYYYRLVLCWYSDIKCLHNCLNWQKVGEKRGIYYLFRLICGDHCSLKNYFLTVVSGYNLLVFLQDSSVTCSFSLPFSFLHLIDLLCYKPCILLTALQYYLQRGFEQQWLSITFSKAIFLGNGLVAIIVKRNTPFWII